MEGKYVIVRGNYSGVFAGILKERNGQEVTLIDCRRIWYWDGACSLSQLAMEGVKKPSNCNVSIPVNEIVVLDIIEIIPTTNEAEKIIREVPEWKIK